MAEDKTTYTATCERFPNLSIPSMGIEFKDGVFTTPDVAKYEALKQHEWWDTLIKEGKPAAPPAAEPAVAPPAEGASPEAEKSGEESSGSFGGVHRGARGSRS